MDRPLRWFSCFCLCCALAPTTMGFAADSGQHPPHWTGALALTPAFGDLAVAPASLAWDGVRYLFSDLDTDSVVLLDPTLQRPEGLAPAGDSDGRRLFDRIGQISLDAGGGLAVADRDNRRITLLDAKGTLVGRFSLPKFSSFAVSASSGNLYVAAGTSGKLISVYGRDGRVVGSFGELKSFADLYGGIDKVSQDAAVLAFLDKVDLASTPDGGVIAAYRFAPLVERYGPTGDLLWRCRLEGPDVDQLTEMFLDDGAGHGEKYVRVRSADGQIANFVTMAVSYEPASRRIFVLLPSQKIVVLSSEGHQAGTLRLSGGSSEAAAPFAFSLVSGRPGELLLFNPLSREIWRARLAGQPGDPPP